MPDNILDVFRKENYPNIDSATATLLDNIYNKMLISKNNSHIFSSLLDAYKGEINPISKGGISASGGVAVNAVWHTGA
jgi:hypothetical protein